VGQWLRADERGGARGVKCEPPERARLVCGLVASECGCWGPGAQREDAMMDKLRTTDWALRDDGSGLVFHDAKLTAFIQQHGASTTV